MGFVMDKMALGQVFSEYFSFIRHVLHLLHTHHHPPLSSTGPVGGHSNSGLTFHATARNKDKQVLIVLMANISHEINKLSKGIPINSHGGL
jgi:hypothetical protein